MDLDIVEVSELLNVSEEQLHRWISDGTIPAYSINAQYRFNRQEIEAWVVQQKSAQEDIFPHKGGVHRFSLFRALSKGDVYGDIDGTTKEAVIKEATERMAHTLNLDPEVLAELLMEREELMPTALGSGFAIPHARDFLLQAQHKDVVTIVFLKQAIPYGALDGKPVDTLFFLLASDDKKHLGLLSKIASLCASKDMKGLLQAHPSKDILIEEIRRWEEKLCPL